jgi:DNA-binding NarL/FixJ family response regulator
MDAFRILLADDHPVFRFGLRSLLASHPGWQVCGEAADGRDAVEKCKRLKPDLLVLDIGMPELNGVDVARQILRQNPKQRILVLTEVDSERVVRDCLDAGVRGWVFKSEGTDSLVAAVEALQRRNSIFSSRVSDLMLGKYLDRNGVAPTADEGPGLSPRQREVVQLLAESKTSKEVAMILNMSVKTAETHRSNIMSKLKLHSIAELVLYAVRNEIVYVHLPSVRPVTGLGNGNGNGNDEAETALLQLN